MAVMIRCKMCGGDLALTQGSTIATCEYCGSTQTVPTQDNEKKLIQFERAERLRRNCEFDKATGVYEAIVADFRQEAEAYWGLVLCKYGIEYVDDPATGKKIPTCHRSSFESIFDDSNFEQTLENADTGSRKVYREEAKRIEEIRKGIIEVSSKEDPYDIFICYKETAEDGQRTIDSVLAQDLYDALTDKGYRTFFARITLEDKLGQEYEPYIFAALNSAKVMLAIGTDYEYFNAVWVKNEWSRYLKLMETDKSKHLIPCYKGIDAYDMPKEFNKLQAQDLGKVGATQDLFRGIEKLLGVQKAAVVAAVPGGGNIVAETLEKAYGFLAAQDWTSAGYTLDTVRGYEPDNVGMLIGKLMLDCKVSKESLLAQCDSRLDENPDYQKAVRVADSNTKARLENYNKAAIYRMALNQAKGNTVESVKQAMMLLEEIRGYQDADQQTAQLQAILKELQAKKKKIVTFMAAILTLGILVTGLLIYKANYWDLQSIHKEAVELLESGEYQAAQTKIDELKAYEGKELAIELRYDFAGKLVDAGQHKTAIALYNEMYSYAGSAERINECKYLLAKKLYDAGEYADAAYSFEAIKGYSDSETMVYACYYKLGEYYWQKDRLDSARNYFEKAGAYQDAAERYTEVVNEQAYREAVTMQKKGNHAIAAEKFKAIIDYKDSLELFCKSCMIIAQSHANSGDRDAALKIYRELLTYKHEPTKKQVNQILENLYNEGLDLLSQDKLQSALNVFESLQKIKYKDSNIRKSDISKQIAKERAAIEGIWYSTDAWFAGGVLWADNGKWAWNSGRSASVVDDYISGKKTGSSYSYDSDTKTFTLGVTKHSNGEKEYLTAQVINGKLIVRSTDPEAAFYPGTYKKIKEVN